MTIFLPKEVRNICSVLTAHGFEAFAVGGAVRDSLLGRTPEDWDVTTNAKPEEVKALFQRTIDTGIEHGTVTVRKHGKSYEVTTYRLDGDYLDSRHPKDVTFTSSLKEDLKRRDFTVNAMAYNETAGLQDYFGGQEDLKAGVIRAVGDPKERFTEDALRILRAVRFSAALGFTIEEKTLAAAKELAPRVALISAERIREELLKTLVSAHPDYAGILSDIGVFGFFYPEFAAKKDGICARLLRVKPEKTLRLAAFFGNAGEDKAATLTIAERVLQFLKFDNDTRDAVLHILKFSGRHLTPDSRELRRFLNECGKESAGEVLDYLAEAEECDLIAVKKEVGRIMNAGECTSLKELAVSGNDLIAAGLRPGREMGRILTSLLEEVLEDPARNTREYLMSRVKSE